MKNTGKDFEKQVEFQLREAVQKGRLLYFYRIPDGMKTVPTHNGKLMAIPHAPTPGDFAIVSQYGHAGIIECKTTDSASLTVESEQMHAARVGLGKSNGCAVKWPQLQAQLNLSIVPECAAISGLIVRFAEHGEVYFLGAGILRQWYTGALPPVQGWRETGKSIGLPVFREFGELLGDCRGWRY